MQIYLFIYGLFKTRFIFQLKPVFKLLNIEMGLQCSILKRKKNKMLHWMNL